MFVITIIDIINCPILHIICLLLSEGYVVTQRVCRLHL